jgi:hypothetical protein
MVSKGGIAPKREPSRLKMARRAFSVRGKQSYLGKMAMVAAFVSVALVGNSSATSADSARLLYNSSDVMMKSGVFCNALFRIGASESMRLNTTGLGIGTTTIGSKLQVNGNAAIGYATSTAGPANGLAVSGKLGVGLTAPTERMQVSGALRADTIRITCFHEGTPIGAGRIRLLQPGGYTFDDAISTTYDVTADDFFGDVVDCNKVVTDSVVTSKVKINNWTIEAPDYVFGAEYKLRALPQVEQFIKTNSHLPDVPSASEMKSNGVDLAEMNMVLLKKIEELTLYTIEQEKRIAHVESLLRSGQAK